MTPISGDESESHSDSERLLYRQGDNENGKRNGEPRFRSKRQAVASYIVEPMVAIFYVSHAIQNAVMPQFLYYRAEQVFNLSGSSQTHSPCVSLDNATINSSYYNRVQQAQQLTTHWNVVTQICGSVPGILIALTLGNLSDRWGRKLPFLISLLGETAKIVILLCIMRFELPMWLYYVSSFVGGSCGGMWNMHVSLFAYITDVTDPRYRSLRFTLLEVLQAFTAALVGLGSGYVINHLGYFYTYGISIVCMSFVLICAAFIMIEPIMVQKENRKPMSLLSQFSDLRLVFFGPKARTALIFGCAACLFFYNIQPDGINSIYALYVMDYPFCWGAVRLGYLSMVRGLSVGVGCVLVVLLFSKIFSPVSMCCIGLLSSILGYIGTAVAKTDNMLYIATGARTLSRLPLPMIKTVMSNNTPPELRATMFCAFGIVEAICDMLSSVVINKVYSATVYTFRPLCFYVAAGCCVCSLILAIYVGVLERLNTARLRRRPRSIQSQ